MRSKLGLVLAVVLSALALMSLLQSPRDVSQALFEPLRVIFGAPQQLQTGVLEVSENLPNVEKATQRLLKPLGAVRLIRRFPTPPSSDTSN